MRPWRWTAAPWVCGGGAAERSRSPQTALLNPRLSAALLVAQLRLYLAYACHGRVGRESLLGCLPSEVIELIGQHLTVRAALHGLVRQSALLCSEGVPPA